MFRNTTLKNLFSQSIKKIIS